MKPPSYFENPTKAKKKLSPQEWEKQNMAMGFQPVPNEKTAGYKHFYNPKEYFMDDKGGFMKLADKDNPNANYDADPTYKPFITYSAPAEEVVQRKFRGEANSGRKAFDFQYSPQGYIGYKYDDGTIKYLNEKGEELGKPTEIAQQLGNGGDVEAKKNIKEQKDWLDGYVNSPKYKERLEKEFDGNVDAELAARKNNLNNTKVSLVEKIGKSPGWVSGINKDGKVLIEKSYNQPGNETIPVHEFGHSLDAGGKRIPASTNNLIKSNTIDVTGDGYYNKPTEFINRLQSIRYLLDKKGIYNAGTADFNPSSFKKMTSDQDIQNNEHYKDVMKTLSGKTDEEKKKQFIMLMNSIAMNNNSDDGTQLLNTGGLVKKTKGYWGGGNVGLSSNQTGILNTLTQGANTYAGTLNQNPGYNTFAGAGEGTKQASAAAAPIVDMFLPGVGTAINAGIGISDAAIKGLSQVDDSTGKFKNKNGAIAASALDSAFKLNPIGLAQTLTGPGSSQDKLDTYKNIFKFKQNANNLEQQNVKFVADQKQREKAEESMAGLASGLQTALSKRDAGYKNGGQIEGKGTGKSDSIKAKVEADSFVVPAENAGIAKEIRKKVLKAPSTKANLKQKGGEEVKLSNGEHLFTPEEKEKIMAAGIDLNALAPESKSSLREYMNSGGDVKGYAKGGPTGDDPFKGYSDRYYTKEKDLARKKQYQSELLELKKRAASGDPVAKGLYMKRGAELAGYINEINKRQGLSNTASGANSNTNGRITAPKSTGRSQGQSNGNKTSMPDPSSSPFSQDYAALEDPNLTPPSTTSPEPVTPTALGSKDWGKELAGTATTTPTATPSATSDAGTILNTGLNAFFDYGLPLLQTGLGLSALKKAGARPVDKIDQDYLNGIATSRGIVDRANNAAKYGYTPEEQAAIDMQNNNLTNAQRFAARNYSGGSGGNAYNMERDALNNSFERGLAAKVGNRQLQMQKQGYADAKQSELNRMLADKADRSRTLFGDTMQAWQQNQSAGAGLVGAGLSNAIGANRYRNELEATAKRNQMYNPQYPSSAV